MALNSASEYFADGITEDIIVKLARCRSLFLVFRNSAFRFKGRDGVLQEIGEQIGAAVARSLGAVMTRRDGGTTD
jgi:adenylate cyclase